jgi:hypothetical protein
MYLELQLGIIILLLIVIITLIGIAFTKLSLITIPTSSSTQLPITVHSQAPSELHEDISSNIELVDNEGDIKQVITNSSANVKEGYYKPRGWLREQHVCQTLEKIYNKPFPTTRPSFLLNPETNERMEYDCYNEELKISAEHNGEQHYIYPNSFHKTDKEFQNQLRRDKYKYDLSIKHNIYQITVPYWVPYDLIPSWVSYYSPERVVERTTIEKLKTDHHIIQPKSQ